MYGGLRYSDFSNAAALLEFQNTRHAFGPGYPLDHIIGAVDMTNKVFGVIGDDYRNPLLQQVLEKSEEYWGFVTLDKDLKIVVSERQNRLVVYEPTNEN